MSNEKHYPLHPNQSHPPIMTCEIPLEEYESIKRENAELKAKLEDCYRTDDLYYPKSEADKVIADLEESHKKEVGQLLIKISELEKLVETADKLLKQKGGFTVKDITFGGVKLEGFKGGDKCRG